MLSHSLGSCRQLRNSIVYEGVIVLYVLQRALVISIVQYPSPVHD